jgi:hypothetical protein
MVMPPRATNGLKDVAPKHFRIPLVEGVLAIMAILLPFGAWFAAAGLNPNGRWSDSPVTVVLLLSTLLSQYWLITLSVIIGVFLLCAYFGFKKGVSMPLAILFLLASIVFSAYVSELTRTAPPPEDEFTD